MAQGSAERLNLKALKRHDDSILSILDSTSYVVLYRLDGESWTKEGIEGTLFIVQRDTSINPYGFFILNRNGTENFAEDLDDEEDLELSQDFIMFRSPKTDIAYGIWVFEAEHRLRIGERMLDLAKLSRETKERRRRQVEVMATQTASVGPIASTSTLPAQSISLDLLFGSPRATASKSIINGAKSNNGVISSPPSSDAGMKLLDSIFGSPPEPPAVAPTSAHQHSRSNGAESAIEDLLYKPAAVPKSPIGLQPVQQASIPSPPILEQAPLPKARPNRVQGPLVPRMISTGRPKLASPTKPASVTKSIARPASPLETMSVLDDVLSSLSSPQKERTNGMLPSQPKPPPVLRSGLARNDFVREILTLLHTDSAFVDALYDSYQSRSAK